MASYRRVENRSAPLILPSSGTPGTLVSIYNLKLKTVKAKVLKNGVKVLLNKLEVPSLVLDGGIIVFQIPETFVTADISTETPILITVIRKRKRECEKLLTSFVFTIDPPAAPQMTAVPLLQPLLPPPIPPPIPPPVGLEPIITGVTPQAVSEGILVNVTGVRFLGGATVSILIAGTEIQVAVVPTTLISPTLLTLIVPILDPGSYLLVVLNPDGTNSGQTGLPFLITYSNGV